MKVSLDAITPDTVMPMQNNMRTVTKEYRCIRPYTLHYFSFAWVVCDENNTVKWECPICGLPQTLVKNAST